MLFIDFVSYTWLAWPFLPFLAVVFYILQKEKRLRPPLSQLFRGDRTSAIAYWISKALLCLSCFIATTTFLLLLPLAIGAPYVSDSSSFGFIFPSGSSNAIVSYIPPVISFNSGESPQA